VASNVKGEKYSSSVLYKMASIAAAVQQSVALRGFGENTTQLMTALADAECEFGTLKSQESASWKQCSINPLQLSQGRAKGKTLQQNIDGALDQFAEDGIGSNFRTPDIPLRKTVRFFSNRRFGDSISES
jgi:hypothetical protein